MPFDIAPRRYDTVTIWLHWSTALLVALQWIGAHAIDWFPRGAPRVDARSVHILVGLLLAGLLSARLIWRATRGRRLPPSDAGLAGLAARAAHYGLYVLLGALLLVGVLLTWARGDSIFGLFHVPPLIAGDRTVAHLLQDVHAALGWMILGLAGLHGAAALAHRVIWQDGVLERMLPGGGRLFGSD